MAPILYLFNALTNYLFVILYNIGLPVPVLSEKVRAVNVSSTSVSFFFFFFLFSFFGGARRWVVMVVLIAVLAGIQAQ